MKETHEEFFATLLKQMISFPPEINPLDFLIAEVARQVEADRSYIYIFRDGGASTVCDNAHQWHRDGVHSIADLYPSFDTSLLPAFAAAIKRAEDRLVTEGSTIPELARDWLRREGITALVITPIKARGGAVIGFLGFDFLGRRIANVPPSVERCIHETANLISVCRERREALNARSNFLAAVSHDLRTPLNSILGFSRLLKAGVDDPAERERYLDSIIFSGGVLLELVNNILDLSRLGAHKMTFAPEPCDLKRLVEVVMSTFSQLAKEKGLELRADFSSLPEVEIDPRRMRQLLFNLIGNAVKFTKEGSITVSVDFQPTTPELGALQLRVRDTGIGIARENIARILRPFEQATADPSGGGAGLGLPICKSLVEAAGGIFTVDSTPGVGSVFAVSLTAVKWRTLRGETVSKPSAPVDSQSRRRLDRLSVLIVDDIEINRIMLSRWLLKLGVGRIGEAESGEAALARLDEERFDCVLSDMKMPGIDGVELLARIRERFGAARPFVALVTADSENRAAYRARGFDSVLLKPIDIDELQHTLERVENATD